MLRVTVNKQGQTETWDVEGKLSGEWVTELERCWRGRAVETGIGLQVNLKAVAYIDAPGKQLLTEMHEHGVNIQACGCMARAVVEEIVREAQERRRQKSPNTVIVVATLFLGTYLLGGGASLGAREKAGADHFIISGAGCLTK